MSIENSSPETIEDILVVDFFKDLFNTCKFIDEIYNDMTVRQMIVIAAIAKHPRGIPMVEVAKETGLATSIISRTCRYFLADGNNSKGFGLIEQFQDSTDARKKSVRLSQDGFKRLSSVVKRHK